MSSGHRLSLSQTWYCWNPVILVELVGLSVDWIVPASVALGSGHHPVETVEEGVH